jgi:hypothetical protein
VANPWYSHTHSPLPMEPPTFCGTSRCVYDKDDSSKQPVAWKFSLCDSVLNGVAACSLTVDSPLKIRTRPITKRLVRCRHPRVHAFNKQLRQEAISEFTTHHYLNGSLHRTSISRYANPHHVVIPNYPTKAVARIQACCDHNRMLLLPRASRRVLQPERSRK